MEVGLHHARIRFQPFPVCHHDGFTTENIRRKAPWQMMFADDVVLCAKKKDVLELELKKWMPMEALEKRLYIILTYFTLVELFCHRRRVDRQSDVSPWPSCSRLSSGFPSPCTISVHHHPSDFVAFPSVVVLLDGTRALLWGAVGAILLTCGHRLILFLFAGCMHVYSPSNFFVSDLVHGLQLFWDTSSLLLSTPAFLCWWVSCFHSGTVELGWIPPLWSVSWSSSWFLCAQVGPIIIIWSS